MNRHAIFTLAMLVAVAGSSATGCKFFEKKVPSDIVQKALEQNLRHMPNTTSAMCGADIRGFASSKVSVKEVGEKNKGVAHVVGTPWPGNSDAPSKCEGDIEFQFSYTSRTYGSRRNRRTETTWYLDSMKLVAVQTKGVKFKEGKEEKASEEGDDDDDKGGKGDDKKKKGDDD